MDKITKVYLKKVYYGMLTRCYNKDLVRYKDHGGRGITVCEEWRKSKESFYIWSLNNGWQCGLQLDRKENSLNYTPNNCRFVTSKVNNRNRRSNVRVTYMGDTKTLVEWAEHFKISYTTIRNRNRQKVSLDKMFLPVPAHLCRKGINKKALNVET